VLVAQREEIRAFPHVAVARRVVVDDQRAEVVPVHQVVGTVVPDRAVLLFDRGADGHVPAVGLAPDRVVAVVAAADAGGRLGDERVGRVLLERAHAVAADRQTRAALCADDVVVHAHPGVMEIHRIADAHGAAGKDAGGVVGMVGEKRERAMFPVHEITADGVAPVHVAPVGAVGVVLIEQVKHAVELHEAVRVVDPVLRSGEMRRRAMGIGEGHCHVRRRC